MFGVRALGRLTPGAVSSARLIRNAPRLQSRLAVKHVRHQSAAAAVSSGSAQTIVTPEFPLKTGATYDPGHLEVPMSEAELANIANAPPSNPEGTTGKISNWVQDFQLSEVSPALLDRCKHFILDGLACALVAAQLPESRVATKSILSMESQGHCSIVGWDQGVGPLAASLINSTYIQGFELDDVHRESPWHANSIILPALMAAIEHDIYQTEGKSVHDGASFLLSTIIGFELGGRVGRALHGAEMLGKGWHSGAIFGPPAAAAAVARQLKLSPAQTEDAMGTAGTQACGLMSAQYEAMAKRMQHGYAARNGLFGALTARDNYTGIDQIFERPYGGFLAVFSHGTSHTPAYDDTVLVKDLGTEWSATEGISIKPYASMLGTHGAIDCVKALQEKYPDKLASPNAVKKITVELSKAWFAHGGQDIARPITVIGAQMSTKYCVAAQLLDHAVLSGQFASNKLNRELIWETIDKTSCEWNSTFDDVKHGRTRVAIELESGEVITDEVVGPSTTVRPMSNADIVGKWRKLAGTCIDSDRMMRIENMVLDMEQLPDIMTLINELKGVTRSAIS